MKQLLSVLSAGLILAGLAAAQDSPTQAGADPSVSNPTYSKPKGYSSGDYGKRAEIFVTGYGLYSGSTTGNGVTHDMTSSGGGSAGYRFNLNAWSSLQGNYGFSRDSQKYTIGGTVSSIPTYLSEVTGSYVYRYTKMHSFQPFAEAGGGIVHFSPGNYGTGSSSSGTPVTNPGTNPVTTPGTNPVVSPGGGIVYVPPNAVIAPLALTGAPVYTGGSAGISGQTRPTFLYGAGVDFPLTSHFIMRAEYRGLLYKQPDFNITGLQTNSIGILSEPTIGFAYRF
jgi:outer membrane immunogenic protein